MTEQTDENNELESSKIIYATTEKVGYDLAKFLYGAKSSKALRHPLQEAISTLCWKLKGYALEQQTAVSVTFNALPQLHKKTLTRLYILERAPKTNNTHTPPEKAVTP